MYHIRYMNNNSDKRNNIFNKNDNEIEPKKLLFPYHLCIPTAKQFFAHLLKVFWLIFPFLRPQHDCLVKFTS